MSNEYEYDNLPVIPKLPENWPPPGIKDPHYTPVAKCGECGRLIYMIEAYCCMNPRCPVQPKGIL